MTKLEINLKPKQGSDIMTCISECLKIAKAIDDTVYLDFDSYSIPISKDSYHVDLFKIYQLEEKLNKK